MTIVTKLNYLQAAVIHSASKDVRFYLCGVYIGRGVIAATDGHRLIIIEDDIDVDEGQSLIIPRDAIINLAKKAKRGNVSIEIKDDGFGLMTCNGQYEYFKFIDGKFPDISRVDMPEPEKPVAEWVLLNTDYLRDFAKSMQILTGNKISQPIVKPTGKNDRAYISMTEYAHGILMPMRQ